MFAKTFLFRYRLGFALHNLSIIPKKSKSFQSEQRTSSVCLCSYLWTSTENQLKNLKKKGQYFYEPFSTLVKPVSTSYPETLQVLVSKYEQWYEVIRSALNQNPATDLYLEPEFLTNPPGCYYINYFLLKTQPRKLCIPGGA